MRKLFSLNGYQQLSFLDRLFGRSTKPQRPRRRRPRPGTKRSKEHTNDPFLKEIWDEVRQEFFPDRPDLDEYKVYWSNRRQKRTLASCFTEERRVIVARELNYPPYHPWLYPLLYHEMCHAYLGDDVPTRNGKRAWHGREFKELEMRHPQMKAFDKWVKDGGWTSAVRSERSRSAHAKRRANAE